MSEVGSPQTVKGTGVVPGIAYAPAGWTRARPALPSESRNVPEADRPAEVEKFKDATVAVAERLQARAAAAEGHAAEVLAATAGLAKDRGWLRAATKRINSGVPAENATANATEEFVTMFEALGGLMAERATDLKDVRDRVIAEILGLPEPGVPKPSSPIILCADDLAPADTAGLDPALILGLVTRLGGPTSHTAIIARQLGIPCIVAAAGLEFITEKTPLLINGTKGTIETGADPEQAQALVDADNERREAIKNWRGPAQTKDGHHCELLANVQDGAGARKAAKSQAEGVGLYRTELSFLSAKTEPSVIEQAKIYGEVLEAFKDHKVVIRTLDAGSDKPIAYANMEEEENPALGVRGIRITPKGDDAMLLRQLDGVKLAASQVGGAKAPWVMAPMIATLPEAIHFAEACRYRGIKPGVMVEVPATSLLADKFLEHVEFMSIGTNDLTQYTMAADRLSPHLATLTNPWQPGVLTLIAMTAAAGKRAGKPVGVCGEAAADPLLACILIGMGITSLSMASAAVPAVGVQLAKVTLEQCQKAAEAVLNAADADEAKAIAVDMLG